MATITVKEVTGKNDWYPVFKTEIVFAVNDSKEVISKYYSKAKQLKDGRSKYAKRATVLGSTITLEQVLDSETKLLKYLGVSVN